MGRWIINPGIDVEIYGNGSFGIPRTSDGATYKVKYIDDNGAESDEATITVEPCGCKASCQNLEFSLYPPNITLEPTQASTGSIEYSIHSVESYGNEVEIESKPSWINAVVNPYGPSQNIILVSTNSENTSVEPRSGVIQLSVCGEVCDGEYKKVVNVTQVGTPRPVRDVTINYTVEFKDVEKGAIHTDLVYLGNQKTINVHGQGGTTSSGKTSNSITIYSTTDTIEDIVNSCRFDSIEANLEHNSIHYPMRENGIANKLSYQMTSEECTLWTNPPQELTTCGDCVLCIWYDKRIYSVDDNTINAILRIGWPPIERD